MSFKRNKKVFFSSSSSSSCSCSFSLFINYNYKYTKYFKKKQKKKQENFLLLRLPLLLLLSPFFLISLYTPEQINAMATSATTIITTKIGNKHDVQMALWLLGR